MSNDSKTAIFKSKGGSDIEIHQFKVWQNSAIWPGRDPLGIDCEPVVDLFGTEISRCVTSSSAALDSDLINWNLLDPPRTRVHFFIYGQSTSVK
jgi:hypothetical protein